jgi:hypothetical protein
MDPQQENEHNPKRESSAVAAADDIPSQMRNWALVIAKRRRIYTLDRYIEDKSMGVNPPVLAR